MPARQRKNDVDTQISRFSDNPALYWMQRFAHEGIVHRLWPRVMTFPLSPSG